MTSHSPQSSAMDPPPASVPSPIPDMLAECVSSLSCCLSHFDGTPVPDSVTAPVCHLLEEAVLRLTDTDPTLAQPGAASLLAPATDLLRLWLARHGTGRVAMRPGGEWPVSGDVSGEHVRLVPRPERRAHTAYTAEPVLEWHQVLAVCPAPSTVRPEPRQRLEPAVASTAASVSATDTAGTAAADGISEATRDRILQRLKKKRQFGSSSEAENHSNGSPATLSSITMRKLTERNESAAKISAQSAGNLHTHIRSPKSKVSPKRVSFESRCAVSPPATSVSKRRRRSGSRSRPGSLARRGRSASAAPASGRRSCAVQSSLGKPRAASRSPSPPPPRLSQAVSMAAGGDLWCSTAADWEQQLKSISDQVERLATATAAKRPEAIMYGQMVIHHNCVLPDLPRFVRCLSLHRGSGDRRSPVAVWLCDAARTLLVPRATLLSACCERLQLYRRPPLLALLTGKRLQFSVPTRLVSACLSLLAVAMPWLAVWRLDELRLPQLTAELGSSEAVEFLCGLTRRKATLHLLRSTEVAASIADLVGDQLDHCEPDQTELSRLVRLLRTAMGPGLADPVRRLLARSQLMYELLRLEKTDSLEFDVRRLLSRLQEDEEAPTGSTPRVAPTPGATSTPVQPGAGLLPTPAQKPGLLPTPAQRPGLLPTPVQRSGLLPTPVRKPGVLQTPVQKPGVLQTPVKKPGVLQTPVQRSGVLQTPVQKSVRLPTPAQKSGVVPSSALQQTPADGTPPVAAPGRLVRLNWEELQRADGDGGADQRPKAETAAAPARLSSPAVEILRRGQRSRLLRTGPCLQLENVQRVQDMGQQRLAVLLCGMLNAGQGGAIYYGVSADGRVSGLQLDSSHKDRLRLGVDKVASNLLDPPVPSDCLKMEFIPVLDRDQSAAGFRLDRHTLFVVVVRCQSPPREVFLVRSQQTAYLRRSGSDGEPQTVPLSLPQLRQLVAAQEMALVSSHQAALQSTAACLRRLLDAAAPTVCGDCGGVKESGVTAAVPADCRKEVAATGSGRAGDWSD